MRRRRRDLTEAERREVAERLAPARAEADRIAAPLMALQWFEADLEAQGLLDRGEGEGIENLRVEGDALVAFVRTLDRDPRRDTTAADITTEVRLAACLDIGLSPASLLALMIRDAEQPVQPLAQAAGGAASGDAFRVIDDRGHEWQFLAGDAGSLIVSVAVDGVVRSGVIEVVGGGGWSQSLAGAEAADAFTLAAETIRGLANTGGELRFREVR